MFASKSDYKAVFFVDAGSDYGLSHFIRSLEIARCFSFENNEILFLLQETDKVNKLITEKGYNHLTVYKRDVEDEIAGRNPLILITDLRENNTINWKKLRRENIFIVSIDDLSRSYLESDIVFNPNLFSEDIKYEYVPEEVPIYRGTKYFIFRMVI